MRTVTSVAKRLKALVARFRVDTLGGTAMIFGLTLPLLVLAVGGGMDLSRAQSHRQQIANALEIACNQSAVEINHRIANGADYYSNFGPSVIEPFARRRITDVGITTPVTITASSAHNNMQIRATSSSPAVFAQVGGLRSLPVNVFRECRYNQANQRPPAGQTLFVESFEQAHNVGRNDWDVLGRHGSGWNGWQTRNAGIEINSQSELAGGSIKFGTFFAELDSDCRGAPNCNANSSMVRTLALTPGNYEISYWYVSRLRNGYAHWQNIVACAATDSDNAVAPYRYWQGETNRIEVHVQRDGQSGPNAASMVDVCIYSNIWIERRISIQVTQAGTYHFTWLAAGRQDTVGGLIDYIRLCKDACA